MTGEEHRPATIKETDDGIQMTCSCGEVIVAKSVLGAFEKGAAHAGVILR